MTYPTMINKERYEKTIDAIAALGYQHKESAVLQALDAARSPFDKEKAALAAKYVQLHDTATDFANKALQIIRANWPREEKEIATK